GEAEESFGNYLCAFVVFLPSRSTFVQLRGKEHAISLPFSKPPCLPKKILFRQAGLPCVKGAVIFTEND
ncbi:MAG: hypothetical protein IJB86_08290, partial [Clostridia bacterium]|nr:hypothetical protein [Clostridia bacterium]